MKLLSIISLLLICFTSFSFSETLEFRKFTLELSKGVKPLTPEQIAKAVSLHNWGQSKAIKVKVKDSKFAYSDTQILKYASEYNEDRTIAKRDTKKLGTTITGTTKPTAGEDLEVTLAYTYVEKVKNMVYEAKGNRVVVSPVMNSFHFDSLNYSSIITVNRTNNEWSIIPLGSGETTKTYIALRVNSKASLLKGDVE